MLQAQSGVHAGVIRLQKAHLVGLGSVSGSQYLGAHQGNWADIATVCCLEDMLDAVSLLLAIAIHKQMYAHAS
jgi:hypothetical protein